jgi:regulator of protease activity HflC (stomatin/prohibitin superfamily)
MVSDLLGSAAWMVGAGVLLVLYLFSCIRVVKEYERAVIFRLGKVLPETRGPGLVIVFRPIDRAVIVSKRVVVFEVPSQDVITRDNVSLKVSAVVYFKVKDPKESVIAVENFLFATSQIAQTTLRSVLGEVTLDELLAEREKLSQRLRQIIDAATEPWGIEVSSVELKSVDLPEQIQRAMGRQAEAEREKRAKVIAAEGELLASEQLLAAANRISQNPTAIQMRYLQTLAEIAVEKNSTILFPLPLELLRVFEKFAAK